MMSIYKINPVFCQMSFGIIIIIIIVMAILIHMVLTTQFIEIQKKKIEKKHTENLKWMKFTSSSSCSSFVHFFMQHSLTSIEIKSSVCVVCIVCCMYRLYVYVTIYIFSLLLLYFGWFYLSEGTKTRSLFSSLLYFILSITLQIISTIDWE